VVEPLLHRLVEALDFPAGLRVIGARDEEGVVLEVSDGLCKT